MPRRQAASAAVASDEPQQRLGPLTKILNDHDFADVFHGETSSKFGRKMTSAPHGDADGDADMVGDDGRNGHAAVINGTTNGTPAGSRLPRKGSFDFENTPVDLNELMLRQLKEDRDGLRYDVEWTRHQVGMVNITPAESRSYQLRLLDLGHQLRQVNHRIHMREAEMHNAYRFGPAPAPYGHQMYTPNPAQQVSFMNAEPPQERRGPGRPLGSKNRARESLAPASTPGSQPPPNSAQKAAALASAGAKRILPSEITVATPSGDEGESRPLAKRPRVEVGSPLGSPAEEDNKVTGDATTVDVAHSGDTTNEDTTVENVVADAATPKIKAATGSVLAAPTPSTPIVPSISANPSGAHVGPNAVAQGTTPGGGADETGPGGSAYQRLGHWMCTLCTSQKYLQHPAPKQPSEPSSWPLRDVSKIVTHYTRMHGEHNRMERCMELGTALQANLGPFRYWIQETKREKIPLEDVREALATLQRGQLPDLLRRFSTAARAFPN
ncbi:hypothetical protein J7T55_003909 [Diaporthe amygdali]|uniref:uncharacterized protein n=1 Tax=Phomopsis amygdali TaxID=1214568 RepID=UPI0022FE9382|nr:uncharacterized protein J7T55_003909 [Diaporthe amygdali]KAJ0117492.1 hypothetical protein J7T55_003909 [Diaporthe amygdali]